MAEYPYSNNSTQKEKRQVLKDTNFSRAQGDYELSQQGRHAQRNSFTGSQGAVHYPNASFDCAFEPNGHRAQHRHARFFGRALWSRLR